MGTKTQAGLASLCPCDGGVSGCGRLSPLEAYFCCGPLSLPIGLPTAGVTMKPLSAWHVVLSKRLVKQKNTFHVLLCNENSKQHCFVLSIPCGEMNEKGLCNFPASVSIRTSWTLESDNGEGI